MKIIDLLNKIANGEEVPHFKVGEVEYFLNWKGCLLEREGGNQGYDTQWFIDKDWLNTEVEIIEEDKKIEKIEYITSDEDGDFTINGFAFDYEQKMQIVDKINEIIDKLNDTDK